MRKTLIGLTAIPLLFLAACSSDDMGPNDTRPPQRSGETEEPAVTVSPGQTGASASASPTSSADDGRDDEATAQPMEGCELPAGDDFVVGQGETCVLADVSVDGNIIVMAGGVLDASNLVVDGDIQAEGHAGITVTGGSVDGDIQLEDGGTASVTGVRIGGNLQAERNGAQDFSGNTIEGNLQCEANDPVPTGGGNAVEGDAEGQCSALA